MARLIHLRLLELRRILLEQTDENHSLSLKQITDKLMELGISAERKTLYTDMQALRESGIDIYSEKKRTTGYFVTEREFQLPELKLLVELVQSSKFITHKKSDELIKKIGELCSVYEARELKRQVHVSDRIKSMNETIYYSVDAIHSAIGGDKNILFKYFDYDINKERVLRKGGADYAVSPGALIWDHENYYMIGFDQAEQKIKHYRVDKMMGINISKQRRTGHKELENMDLSAYGKGVFSMFSGREEQVRLRCKNSLVGVFIDRFGKDIIIFKDGDQHFCVNIKVNISPQFFGWIAGLSGEAVIASPKSVCLEFREYLENILTSH